MKLLVSFIQQVFSFVSGSLPNTELIVPPDVAYSDAASLFGKIPSGNLTVLLDLGSSLGIPLPDKIFSS